MDEINLASTAFWKCAIRPEETGIYKANINGKDFYILVEDCCVNDIRLKWLGELGIYKHGIFLPYTSENWTAKENQSVEIFNYSLSDAVARASVVSKDNKRVLTLRKIQVPTDIYLLYMDLAKSPKVYLNIGDELADRWIEVSIKWQPNLDSKKNFHNITIVVELPDDYIQKL